MKKFLLLVCFPLIFFGAFAQSNNGDVTVVNKLKNYLSTYDPEKAYLQFDRPYYFAGDTIFFKAYVIQGGHHKLSTSSGVLHVDFINTENNIDQSIKMKLDSGICWGDFALPDTLPKGNYRIRAYTQWMQNSGGPDFFEQTFAIGSFTNKKASDKSGKKSSSGLKNKIDLQFFSESGTLVEGIRAKMAFKAIGTNGLGTYVKGVVLDKEDKTVCSLESSHLGMGYFVFIPEKGNTYHARVSFADGTQSLIDLPKAETSGISLSLIADSVSTISIRIMANQSYFEANQNKDFLLVIYSGGKVINYSYKQDVAIITLDLDRKVLQTGVSTISLFSQDGEPLCERLLFVQNNDRLKLNIQTDKTDYNKKEKVNLVMKAISPADLLVSGHFSMTIIDERQMPRDEDNERNIMTSLLLTSDLKGYVEQPNYYFKDTSDVARRNLDLLMLTQGYRGFEWKKVLEKSQPVLAFQPEHGLEINGRITNLSDKPIADGTVTLIPSSGGTLLTTTSDSLGYFHFSNLVFTDTAHVVLSAVNEKGGNSTRITYINTKPYAPFLIEQPNDLPVVEDNSMSSYFEEEKKMHEEIDNYGPNKFKMLKEVIVKGVKPDNLYRTQSFAGAGHADQVMHADEIGSVGGPLSTSLNGRLRGVSFLNGIPSLTGATNYSPMLLVVDGTEIRASSSFNVDDIPSSQVETIEVLKYASESIYGMEGAGGVMIITTKNGDDENKNIASIGVLPITPMGFYKARTFYSPKYDHAESNAKVPEMRSTIYWNPEIKTGQDGSAGVDYYNADRAGTYNIIVEGIDVNGNIGRMVYRYKVE